MSHLLIQRGRYALAVTIAAALVALAVASGPSGAGTTKTESVPVPLAGFTTYVRATHFLGRRAYKAEHFFKQIKPGVLQGIVVRKINPAAPVIELEWAISSERYRRLPARHKRFWHPLAPRRRRRPRQPPRRLGRRGAQGARRHSRAVRADPQPRRPRR